MIPDGPKRHPVERLAKLLLQSAANDPCLLGRSGADIPRAPYPAPLPPRLNPNGPSSLAESRNLEELVALALACAGRAEEAACQAQEVSRMARRRMSVAAVIAAVAILGGAGSVALAWYNAAHPAELGAVVSALREASDMQQRAVTELAGMSQDVAALRGGIAAALASPASKIKPDAPIAPGAPGAVEVVPAAAASAPVQAETWTPAAVSPLHPYHPRRALYPQIYTQPYAPAQARHSIQRSNASRAMSTPSVREFAGN
jgi:hypothetical protein